MLFRSSPCTAKALEVPVVWPAAIVIVAPFESVIVRSLCGALSTLALSVAVPAPSFTVTSSIVTVVVAVTGGVSTGGGVLVGGGVVSGLGVCAAGGDAGGAATGGSGAPGGDGAEGVPGCGAGAVVCGGGEPVGPSAPVVGGLSPASPSRRS